MLRTHSQRKKNTPPKIPGRNSKAFSKMREEYLDIGGEILHRWKKEDAARSGTIKKGRTLLGSLLGYLGYLVGYIGYFIRWGISTYARSRKAAKEQSH